MFRLSVLTVGTVRSIDKYIRIIIGQIPIKLNKTRNVVRGKAAVT